MSHRNSKPSGKAVREGRRDPRVSPLAARIRKANYHQDRRGACLICKDPFQTCAHSIAQVDDVIALVKADDLRHEMGL